jgi:hypothetical protein
MRNIKLSWLSAASAMMFWGAWVFALLLICLLIMGPQKAKAEQPNLCRAPYALLSPNFKYKAYKEGVRGIEKYQVVVLWNTFGNKLENYTRELQDPHVIGTELILFNETCVSRNDCGKYETLYGYSTQSLGKAIANDDLRLKNKLQAEAKRAADYLLPRLRADQQCYINVFLETLQKPNLVLKAASWVMPYFNNGNGRCKLVWNPRGSRPGPLPQGFDVVESHGDRPQFVNGPCIANPDGTVLRLSDYPAYLNNYGKKCLMACTWGLNDNCNLQSGPRIDPRRRQCSDTSDFKNFRAPMLQVQNQKPMPEWSAEDDKAKEGCKTFVKINDGNKKGFLWKQSDPPCCGRGAVTFLPGEYNKLSIPLNKVFVMKAGNKIASAYERGVYSEDKSNRQFWRFRRLAKDFDYNVVAHFGSICAVIPNPTIRND